jgi:hypothetical protein
MAETIAAQKFRKATIVPIRHVFWQLNLAEPFQVAPNMSFEDAHGWLKPELFEVWRDMVSKRERDDLAKIRFALVHRFESSGHMGREEAASEDLAFKIFLCLQLIKPTRSTFQRIQVKFLNEKDLDVVSFGHEGVWPNIPDAESINDVDLDDIMRLRSLWPSFQDVVLNGPENVRRAIRHFNVGYSELRDPIVQIVTWMMGIESLFVDETTQLSRKELTTRIQESVGLDTDIYESSPMREYIGAQPVKVGDVLDDLQLLRNRFVHGQWIPPEWKSRKGRSGLSSETVFYADVLREAASFILRRGITNYLQQRTQNDTRE